jgi:hypothetical protein
MEILSEDVLLKIFLHCLDTSPQFWPTLTHVCQSWRRTVLTSPRSLRLRLYYQHGRPVSKTPDCWPTLPVVVQYGGSPALDLPAPEAKDNVVAALKQSSRVCSINLVITRSLLEKLSTISEPFLELEELVLLSQDNDYSLADSSQHFSVGPTSPYSPLDQDCLSLLPATSFALPRPHRSSAVRNSSCWVFFSRRIRRCLVWNDPTSITFTPFLFPFPVTISDCLHRQRQRIALPALAYLEYRGTSNYLDNLVARIDAPCLGDLDVTFFNQFAMEASQLGQFIERIEILKSLSQADVQIIQACYFHSLFTAKSSHITWVDNIVRAISPAVVLDGSNLQPFFPFPFPCKRSTRQFDSSIKWAGRH